MSCQGIRAALADCILRSDCVLRSDPPRSPQECLKDHVDELPEECQLLRKSFFECKRGMVRPCPLLSLSLPARSLTPPSSSSLARPQLDMRSVPSYPPLSLPFSPKTS